MATVQISQLTKRYDADEVVRSVDLDVREGELLVIVGPSGCGKTSVLRMVAGLEPATRGQVLVDGDPVADTHRLGSPPGMMFQAPTLYPHMTVAENLGFPLKMAGCHRREIRRVVGDTAEMLGLAALLPRRPSQLSGGQQQRVAMGRALIRRPALLLMDEPMSNLDAKLRTELRATIALLQHRFGITTIYVTHDQVEAMALGDRIAVMRSGRIVQLGTPVEIYRRPVDVFVATFMGTPMMNLFVGHVTEHGDELRISVGGSSMPLGRLWRHERQVTGGDVVVGVRPQAFRFTGDGMVVDVEAMRVVGDRVDIDATLPVPPVAVMDDGHRVGTGHTRLRIDLPAHDDVDVELWRPSHLVVDPEDVHLFDIETGRSLRPAGRREPDRQLTRATTYRTPTRSAKSSLPGR